MDLPPGVMLSRKVLGISECRACTLVAADRKMSRYQPRGRRPISSCALPCAILPTSVAGSAIGDSSPRSAVARANL